VASDRPHPVVLENGMQNARANHVVSGMAPGQDETTPNEHPLELRYAYHRPILKNQANPVLSPKQDSLVLALSLIP